MRACDQCLSRSALLGFLAPHIARRLSEKRRVPALLRLDDDALIAACCGLDSALAREFRSRFDAKAARQLAKSRELSLVCRHDQSFPNALIDLPDAPRMLYVRGAPEWMERLALERPLAIVGSRRGSPYGLEVAYRIARELAACGVPIVSGMALGIDSAAHEGALDGGGSTVAVLAGGADVPYPSQKRFLYERISANGTVVSELPPGFRAFPWCFPARNRIMAGLAAMTVVVEGAAGSGSLITARFAADMGRDVGAVPGQISSPLAAGPNDLIADGACVVRSAQDVLYGPGEALARAERAAPQLEERLQHVLDEVEQGASSIDAIAAGQEEVPQVMAALTELELMGLVRRVEGGRYIRRV